jgi:hypothetical protein
MQRRNVLARTGSVSMVGIPFARALRIRMALLFVAVLLVALLAEIALVVAAIMLASDRRLPPTGANGDASGSVACERTSA